VTSALIAFASHDAEEVFRVLVAGSAVNEREGSSTI
jgi:hypothetical protein